jgi:hypothetical protein
MFAYIFEILRSVVQSPVKLNCHIGIKSFPSVPKRYPPNGGILNKIKNSLNFLRNIICSHFAIHTYIHTYHSRFIPKKVAEGDTHVLPNLGGKPIVVLLQSISGVSAINPLVTFHDIHGREKGAILLFWPGHHTRLILIR